MLIGMASERIRLREEIISLASSPNTP